MTLHRRILNGLVILSALAASPSASLACSCKLEPIEDEFARTDTIAVVEVVSKVGRDFDPYDGRNEITAYEYELKPIKTYKGGRTTQFYATSPAQSSLCGVDLKVKGRYVIWTREPSEGDLSQAGPHLVACSRTKPVKLAQEDIEWLESQAGRLPR